MYENKFLKYILSMANNVRIDVSNFNSMDEEGGREKVAEEN